MIKLHMFSGLRDFFILWASQTVSSLGTAMTSFALVVWVYGQKGTASSITLLTICSFLPTILFRFAAGAAADRWDKKRVMLCADLLAACGTGVILLLYALSALQIWHLYVVNFLLSCMNAFQVPAAYVATSLLVPKEQYVRVGGLQSFAGSAVAILAPALGSAVLTFGGMTAVLALDLASFAVAFCALLFFVRIPDVPRDSAAGARGGARESFLQSCAAGINFLREHAALLRLILFFTVINFLAKLGGDGMMPAYILGRSGGDQRVLGMVQAAVAVGTIAGSVLVTLTKPAKNRVNVIFGACCLTFLIGNVGLSFVRALPLWMSLAAASYVPVAVLGANLTALTRACVPVDMQGRVFSVMGTLQNCSIPLGLYLGGVLADYVFEPFMARSSPVRDALAAAFGTGGGAGIAVMFCAVGITGTAISAAALRQPLYQNLNTDSIPKDL